LEKVLELAWDAESFSVGGRCVVSQWGCSLNRLSAGCVGWRLAAGCVGWRLAVSAGCVGWRLAESVNRRRPAANRKPPAEPASLFSQQSEEPRTEAIQCLEWSLGNGLRDVAPCNGDVDGRSSLTKRAVRGVKSETSIAAARAEAFCQVEWNTGKGAPELGTKISIISLYGFHEWAGRGNDIKSELNNRGACWVLHAPPSAFFMTWASRGVCSLKAHGGKNARLAGKTQ
jgi:hypothetical protein